MMDVHLCKCLSPEAHLEALGVGNLWPVALRKSSPVTLLTSALPHGLPGSEGGGGSGCWKGALTQASSESPPTWEQQAAQGCSAPSGSCSRYYCRSLLPSHPVSHPHAQVTPLVLMASESRAEGSRFQVWHILQESCPTFLPRIRISEVRVIKKLPPQAPEKAMTLSPTGSLAFQARQGLGSGLRHGRRQVLCILGAHRDKVAS